MKLNEKFVRYDMNGKAMVIPLGDADFHGVGAAAPCGACLPSERMASLVHAHVYLAVRRAQLLAAKRRFAVDRVKRHHRPAAGKRVANRELTLLGIPVHGVNRRGKLRHRLLEGKFLDLLVRLFHRRDTDLGCKYTDHLLSTR